MARIQTRVGKALRSGDLIGIIAPASPSEQSRIDEGIRFIESQGYRTRVVLKPSAQYGETQYLFSSDSPKARAKAMHSLFEDKEVRAIITTRGGYGSMEILPLLDFKRLGKSPKPLVGFSDTTTLLNNLCQKSGIATVHGPSVESMAKAWTDEIAKANAEALFAFLSGENADTCAGTVLQNLFGAKSVSGPLLGGSLSVLSALMGTPWEPKFDGSIVCFEEISEKPFRIHRMLFQMKLAGKFKKAKGVLLGSFKDCVHPQKLGATLDEVLKDIFSDLKIPVFCGGPFGHDRENRPLAFGIPATIAKGRLVFEGCPVKG